jgi:hypothetical protein
MWVHPRYDQVAGALKWLQQAASFDLGANTRALVVLPLITHAVWFQLVKRMKCLLVIPAGELALQQWTTHGWKDASTKYATGVFSYPLASGM